MVSVMTMRDAPLLINNLRFPSKVTGFINKLGMMLKEDAEERL